MDRNCRYRPEKPAHAGGASRRLAGAALLALAPWAAVAAPEAEVLSLDDAIERALEANFTVRIVEADAEIARRQVEQERGVWDPVGAATWSLRRDQNPPSADPLIRSNEEKTNGGAFSLGLRLPTGASVELELESANRRGDFNDFADEFRSFTGVSLAQPLLRNVGESEGRTRIRVARRDYRKSRAALRAELIDTVTDVTALYNLVALAKEEWRVAEQSRDLARKLVADTQRRSDVGAVERLSVRLAESRLAARELDVIDGGRRYRDTLNELKRAVSDGIADLLEWRVDVAGLPQPEAWAGDLNSAFAFALENRPDMRQARLDVEKAILLHRNRRNRALPQLDLLAGYGSNALERSFSDSLGSLTDFEDESYFVGFRFERPLLNREARAARAAARIAEDRSQLAVERLKQSVAIEVDNAIRRIEAERERREWARQGRELAAASLQAEERKLQVGASTTFVVLELQEDLASAQVRAFRADAEYNIALARYWQAIGATLERAGVEF